MSLLFSTLIALLLQLNPSVVWKAAVNHKEGDRYQLVVTGQIGKDYYVHPMSDPHVGTELEVNSTDRVFLEGKPVEEFTPSEYKGAQVVVGTYVLKQELQLAALRLLHKRNTDAVLLEYKHLVRKARKLLYAK